MSKLETGAIVYFDATASGPQILGLSTCCISSMQLTNVIPTYDLLTRDILRRDLYLDVTEEMYKHIGLSTILDIDKKKRRKQVKKPMKLSA